MPTRPALGWSDLADARVGLWGVGREADAAVRRLAVLGVTPVLVDDDPARTSQHGPVLATGEDGGAALAGCDVVVKAPGIPPTRPTAIELLAEGVTLAGGLALWLHDADPDRVVCVTGTKGKSTTVSVLGHLLRGLGVDAFVGGNLGAPPFEPASGADEADVVVLEVSSYQAADVAAASRIVAVTSLSADHLQWHGSMSAYAADKLSLSTAARVEVVVAGDDPGLREHDHLLPASGVEWTGPVPEGGWAEALGLRGRHSRIDAAVAAACAVHLGIDGADDGTRLRAAAAGFVGLPSRLAVVAEADGVTVVDDSLSTNVLSASAALEAFADRPVALLVGGQDRGIDHAGLGDAVAARRSPTLVLGLASNGAALLTAVRERLDGVAAPVELRDPTPTTNDPAGLVAATRAAVAWARDRGGVVLLSPAAPSFDHFRDYAARGEAFTATARTALGLTPT